MTRKTDFLIIGAGPFGISMSAYCKHNNIDHLIIGKTMDFWKSNMPKGMLLRSGVDWHLDPLNLHTIEKYLETENIDLDKSRPLSLNFYLDYVNWFTKQKGIKPINNFVSDINYNDNNFIANLKNGEKIEAKSVLLALGFKHFKNIPKELSSIIPENRLSHTCDLVDLDQFKNKKCLIIGGRQSAFETAALLNEAGAKNVYISHRHDTPDFTESDWSWVLPMLDKIVDDPNWFRNLSEKQRDDLNKRFWTEGRLKLEPWLSVRLKSDSIKFFSNTNVVTCSELSNIDLEIEISNGEKVIVDHVILATGYKVNMENIPLLNSGNILEKLKLESGFPVLDNYMQTNIPGLFVTSMAATQDFGSFFGFTVSVNASAKMIGKYFL